MRIVCSITDSRVATYLEIMRLKTLQTTHCTVLTGQISLSLGMFVYADEPPLAIYLPIPKYSTYQNVGPYFLKSQVSFRPQFSMTAKRKLTAAFLLLPAMFHPKAVEGLGTI